MYSYSRSFLGDSQSNTFIMQGVWKSDLLRLLSIEMVATLGPDSRFPHPSLGDLLVYAFKDSARARGHLAPQTQLMEALRSK